ncbi:NAD(P)-dependent oxidoreductase [Amphritea sp. HPY]|uniref:NAD(P)-dependent oxidoreductase n=1 Tax=Amphritea sp. HPY TaxID=3421652 RepID=UPI003D7EB26E
MTILVVGASGATGRLLVQQLLNRGREIRVIVRSPDALPEEIRSNANLSVIEASVLNLSDAEMARHVEGCTAVASCLGHTLSFKGIYGQPRRLVTDATHRLCNAIRVNAPEQPVKFVLMNTTGNRNHDCHEPISFAQQCVLGLLRLLLPPHVDNEQAADYLRTQIGQDDNQIGWSAVRPDGLIDTGEVSEYELYPSPIRSAIFDAGKTSRINVGHFMAELICNDEVWRKWQGQMPVVYNKVVIE